MGPMNRIFIPAVVLLLLAACDGPLPFMAGGELKGKTENAPFTWQLASDSAVAQLETRPGEPYSINLTYVQFVRREISSRDTPICLACGHLLASQDDVCSECGHDE
mgnify:CR=1 FL=1